MVNKYGAAAPPGQVVFQTNSYSSNYRPPGQPSSAYDPEKSRDPVANANARPGTPVPLPAGTAQNAPVVTHVYKPESTSHIIFSGTRNI